MWGIMAITVSLDAFQAIPLQPSYKFFRVEDAVHCSQHHVEHPFISSCFRHCTSATHVVGAIYDPSVGPGYAFILNLVCTSFITFFFIPERQDSNIGSTPG